MDCDRVFAVLTRGPFPTGCEEDRAVEAHLAACRSCRRLAEALRPSGSDDSEPVAPEESATLPCYGSAGRRGAALPLRRRNCSSRSSDWVRVNWGALDAQAQQRRLARLTLALLVGVAVGLLLHSLVDSDRRANRSAPSPAAQAVSSPAQSAVLLSARLSQACWGESPTSPRGAAAARTLACCTSCHRKSQRRELSLAGLGVVARSCQACHLD